MSGFADGVGEREGRTAHSSVRLPRRRPDLEVLDTPRADARLPPAGRKILSAAEECLQRSGLRTSLTDIANEARVSRPTVYRYFNDRDDILREIGLRQVEKFLAYARLQLRDVADPSKQLVMAVSLLMDGWPEGARLPALSDPEVRWAVYELVSRSPDYYQVVKDYLMPILRQVPDSSHRSEEVVELVVRLILSVPLLSGAMTRHETRYHFLQRFLAAPAFGFEGRA